jgi:hypothetical protein
MGAALDDGTFAFHGVPPGSYRLHAELGSPALRRRSEPVLLEVSQADLSGLRLELPAK